MSIEDQILKSKSRFKLGERITTPFGDFEMKQISIEMPSGQVIETMTWYPVETPRSNNPRTGTKRLKRAFITPERVLKG